jgi:uncharacterized membrane protein YdbT with pleckstrin-like domain
VPYPTRNLNPGEVVALDLRPHWWYFGRQILTGVPLVVVIAAILSWDSKGFVRDAAGWIVTALVVVWAVWLTVKYLAWSRTYFVVSNQRVVYRTGIMARHGVEIPLERINNINFHQSIWERLIGAGNLEVQSAGEQGTSSFDFVRHPDGVQQEIYRQMESRERHAAGYGADALGEVVAKAVERQAAPVSVPQQIEELARLRDRGYITAEEYERKKAELLDRM